MSEDEFRAAVRVPDDVLHQTLPDGETVFLDLRSEQYFGLDAVATRMWQALVQAGTVEAAHQRLVEEFDADPAKLRSDLRVLLDRLVARGLLAVGDQ